MIPCFRYGLPLGTAALMVSLGAGCDSSPPRTPVATTAPTTAPADDGPGTPGQVKPGWAKGRVLGSNGQPIAVADKRIIIGIRGTDFATGARIELSPEVDADGYYTAKLSRGSYRPITARIEVSFNGQYYPLALDPASSGTRGTWESTQGIVQDFTWNLTGPLLGEHPERGERDGWHGGTMRMIYEGYLEDRHYTVPIPPPGTKVVFTLTPQGPLADGSDGKPLTFERTYLPGIGLDKENLFDLPLAHYKIQGQEIRPDGGRAPLLFFQDGKWLTAIDGTFPPDLDNQSLKPVSQSFTRPADVLGQ